MDRGAHLKVPPTHLAARPFRMSGLLTSIRSSSFPRYLFQKDKLNTELDTGDKSIQCGRRVDSLKLWMAWTAVGTKGYEAHIDNLWACARHLRDQVVEREAFSLVAEPMCTNVNFWYEPPSVRAPGAPARMSPEWRKIVHVAAATVKEEMQRRGTLMVGFQSIPIVNDPSPPNFFRMVVISMGTTKEDMDFLLDEIDTIGRELSL